MNPTVQQRFLPKFCYCYALSNSLNSYYFGSSDDYDCYDAPGYCFYRNSFCNTHFLIFLAPLMKYHFSMSVLIIIIHPIDKFLN